MNPSEELARLKEQLEAERVARDRAERRLQEAMAQLQRLNAQDLVAQDQGLQAMAAQASAKGFAATARAIQDDGDDSPVHRQLKDQRAFFEAILNKTPSDIIVADTQYRYLFVNPSAVPNDDDRRWMIGRTNEEYCKHTGKPDKTAKARRQIFERALETRKMLQWEEATVDNQGETQYYLRSVQPILDDQDEVLWVIIYAIRITERKEFEDQIRRSEKRYRDLFNFSQALICTHDMDGRLLAVNPEISRILGYTEEEMLGRKIQEFIPDDHRERFASGYLRDIRKHEHSVSGVFCVMRKDGERIYLLYKNYRMEEDGREPYVIGFSQDITDRIKMEKELRLAKRETDEAARAKESFLAHMSHEIRTPMSGVLGIASLLGKTQLDRQQRNYLQLIQESANNLLVIVNDILDLEKIVAGKLQLEKISFKIVDKIATTIQSYIYRAEEKELGLIFQNSIPADMVVKGDPYRLSQVLNNILSNALKFTKEGHITISTGISESEGGWVVVEITISDTGIGINNTRIKTIFEPFEQADAAISRQFGGTGLGLAISKNMVEMQNGELLVRSEEGKGSSFTIRIPYQLSAGAMKDNESDQTPDYRSLGPKKVLVAEDVELNQYLARHILESWNFEVVIVDNGRSAVERLEREQFDCILMDVQMPEMDGIEATRVIRKLADPVKANIPIIALTANALKGDSEKYLAVGMNDYLAKPFDEERLFRAISRNLPANNQNIDTTPMLSAEPKLYDLTMVRSISGGDEGFIRKMVALFIETVPQNVQDLRKATDAENWEQVGKTAHKLKSTVDSMGIKSIHQEIRKVEANAKQLQSLPEIPSLVGRIETVIHDCIDQLQAEIKA